MHKTLTLYDVMKLRAAVRRKRGVAISARPNLKANAASNEQGTPLPRLKRRRYVEKPIEIIGQAKGPVRGDDGA